MSKKTHLVALFLILLYVILVENSIKFPKDNPVCNIGTLRSLMPWDSACFYTAVFDAQLDARKILIESKKLERFKERNGISHHIIWYRTEFYKRFRDVFDVTQEELDQNHWDYIKADPDDYKYHIEYLKTLSLVKGQAALDRYCNNYVPIYRPDVVFSVMTYLRSADLTLNLQSCNKKSTMLQK